MEKSEGQIKPNFLIVGAAKAATTTIHHYLSQHPEIFMSKNKEPSFFAFAQENIERYYHPHSVTDLITNYDEYLKLFENSKHEKVIGESSTPYLFLYEKTIKNIKKYCENYADIKILIVLRNPVERAYSQYLMYKRECWEPMSFEKALKNEKERMINNYHIDFAYFERGLYANQVEAYLKNFNNVKVILYENFKNDNEFYYKEIFNFLGLSEIKFTKTERKNIGQIPKNKFLVKIINRKNIIKSIFKLAVSKKWRKQIKSFILSKNLKKPPTMNEAIRQDLKKLYKPDLKKLEIILNLDLSHWYK